MRFFTILGVGTFCLSLTPRPLKFPSPFGEGAGVRPRGRGGVSDVLYLHLSSLISFYLLPLITDPTPLPSPAWAGNRLVFPTSDAPTI